MKSKEKVDKMAKGILVAVYKKIHDPDKLKAYAANADPVMGLNS